MKHQITLPNRQPPPGFLPTVPFAKPNAIVDSLNGGGRRRHICIVTETYPPEVNGVAFTLARLSDGLRQQGHEVSLVRPRQKNYDAASSHVNFLDKLVRSLPLPGYKGLRLGLPAWRALRRRWRDHRPDVVYVATEGLLGLSAVRVARRMGIPVFSGFHTNFHSYLHYYGAAWLEPAILRYLRWFHNQTAGTIVACADLGDQLRAIGVKNVSILGRGVDSQRFSPQHRSPALRQSWDVSPGELIVLYVGRLAPEKNLTLAIDAYRAMQQRGNAVRFILVGDGPLRAGLQAQHRDLVFAGVQTGDALSRYYASADIFLFPSETETFGNVTLEAMASGLAVVAYDYAAAHHHIRHGASGLLVPLGQRNEFIDAAVAIADAGQYLPRLRQAARARAAALDWSRIVGRFATLLEPRQRFAVSDDELSPRQIEANLA